MKRGKRGQVTIFVIIAIIIVAAIATFFLLKPARPAKLPSDVQAIRDYARSCAESAFEDSLVTAGIGGGYMAPEEVLETEEIIVSYWYSNKTAKVPSIEEIEKEISSYVETTMEGCNFEKFGYEIEKKEASAETRIKEENVEIILDFPIVARKGEEAYRLEEPYKIKKEVRIGLMHKFSSDLIEKIKEEPEYRHLSYMASTFNMNGMNVTIISYDANNDIYIIDELLEEHYLKGEPYTFMFAANFE